MILFEILGWILAAFSLIGAVFIVIRYILDF